MTPFSDSRFRCSSDVPEILDNTFRHTMHVEHDMCPMFSHVSLKPQAFPRAFQKLRSALRIQNRSYGPLVCAYFRPLTTRSQHHYKSLIKQALILQIPLKNLRAHAKRGRVKSQSPNIPNLASRSPHMPYAPIFPFRGCFKRSP